MCTQLFIFDTVYLFNKSNTLIKILFIQVEEESQLTRYLFRELILFEIEQVLITLLNL